MKMIKVFTVLSSEQFTWLPSYSIRCIGITG